MLREVAPQRMDVNTGPTISAVNVDNPCNVFSRTAEYRVFQRWQLLFLINSIGYRKMAKVEQQESVQIIVNSVLLLFVQHLYLKIPLYCITMWR